MATPIARDSKDINMAHNADNYGSPTAKAKYGERLLLKLDLHILTPMFFLNFLSLMGRTNIGAALIQGLPHELHLDAIKVFLAITMPLVMLILFEVSSNLLMKWLETRFNLGYMRYLSLITICLGTWPGPSFETH